MNIKNKNIIIAILLIFGLVSCNLTKRVVQKNNNEDIGHLSGEEFLKRVKTIQPNFQTAYIKKMSVDLKTEDKNLSFQATCKIQKDSAIHLSIRPFMGIELFKVELTPENIVVVDKISGNYYKEDTALLKDLFGLDMDYQQIESILSNRINFEKSNYVLVKDSAEYLFFQDKNVKQFVKEGIVKIVGFDKKGKLSEKLIIDTNRDLVISVDYLDFNLSNKTLFPHKIKISLSRMDMKNKGNLDFSIEKAVFNQPLKLRKTNLSRYKKGDVLKLFYQYNSRNRK